MTPQTDTLLAVAAQSGAVDGSWFQTKNDGREVIPVVVSLQAGTATWSIAGRNSPLDDAIVLDTGSADEAIQLPRYNQIRVSLSAATGATFRATTDKALRTVA